MATPAHLDDPSHFRCKSIVTSLAPGLLQLMTGLFRADSAVPSDGDKAQEVVLGAIVPSGNASPEKTTRGPTFLSFVWTSLHLGWTFLDCVWNFLDFVSGATGGAVCGRRAFGGGAGGGR